MTSRIFTWPLVLASLTVSIGCPVKRHRASPPECQEIFERLVDIEMREQGFRDPVVASNAKERLRRELAPLIAACEGRTLSERALACVRQARRAEEIIHVCLE